MDQKDKELWIRFACAALSSFEDLYAPDQPDNIRLECYSAAAYAEEMCKIFHDVFED